MLDSAQGMVFIVVGFIMIGIMVRILVVIHGQDHRMKELEARMKATDEMEATDKDG